MKLNRIVLSANEPSPAVASVTHCSVSGQATCVTLRSADPASLPELVVGPCQFVFAELLITVCGAPAQQPEHSSELRLGRWRQRKPIIGGVQAASLRGPSDMHSALVWMCRGCTHDQCAQVSELPQNYNSEQTADGTYAEHVLQDGFKKYLGKRTGHAFSMQVVQLQPIGSQVQRLRKPVKARESHVSILENECLQYTGSCIPYSGGAGGKQAPRSYEVDDRDFFWEGCGAYPFPKVAEVRK
eukprot:1157324-Pelagomonas_calceolata.AAC.6